MGIGDWKRKMRALGAEMARRAQGQPRLELVKPKRASGPVPRIVPEDWFSEAEQARMGSLPVCRGCADWVVVGEAGLVGGAYCAQCAHARGFRLPAAPEAPPAA